MDSIPNNAKLLPSFFQALPNYSTQCLAIVQLLRHYNWSWIGIITSDDDAGENQSRQELKKMVAKYDICVEYIIKIYAGEEKSLDVQENTRIINHSTSEVVVICGKHSMSIVIFIELRMNKAQEKTYIVPAGWITQLIMPPTGKPAFHGSLVFSPASKIIPNLTGFLKDISIINRPHDILVEDILAYTLQCPTSDPVKNQYLEMPPHKCNRSIKLGDLHHNLYYTEIFGVTYLVYKSVYAMAHSLHEMQLLMPKNIKDKYKEIQILLQKVPVSKCTEQCPAGYKRMLKPGIHKCCFECFKCSDGEITNETDSVKCYKCPEDQWPNDLNQCVPKPTEVLSYKNEPAVLIVSIISVLCFFKASTILGIFIIFRDTPIVKLNNQTLSFVLLVSIMLSFLCVFLFLGRPTHVTCMLRQTSFGIIFSVAISSILAKTFMVYMAFKATKPGSCWRKYIGVKLTNCVVFFSSFLQVLLNIIWLSTSPPFPERNTHLYQDKIIFQCNEGSMLAFSMLLGYIGLLAAVSFIVAFLARNLPDSFNEAKNITFSMLVVCSVWVAFIPAYMSVTGKNTVLVEIFAIISSNFGILGCIFFPKCYIILVRPDLNSKNSLSRQLKPNT